MSWKSADPHDMEWELFLEDNMEWELFLEDTSSKTLLCASHGSLAYAGIPGKGIYSIVGEEQVYPTNWISILLEQHPRFASEVIRLTISLAISLYVSRYCPSSCFFFFYLIFFVRGINRMVCRER